MDNYNAKYRNMDLLRFGKNVVIVRFSLLRWRIF